MVSKFFMNRFLKIFGIIFIIIGLFWAAASFYFFLKERSIISNKKALFREELKGGNMKIASAAFEHNQAIPAKYTCDGENINPPLRISGIPAGTKSLVLISNDPDAPMGTWVHWTVWNILPETKEIGEDSMPAGGVEGITSFGNKGYGGPCPPSGTHRYFFKLYAVDKMLDLPLSTKASDIEKAMAGHILDKSEIIGLYKKR